MTRFARIRVPGEEQRTSSLELFFDLVFVFAVTQVSHLLLKHLTWAGVGQSALVLLVIWWAWNYTAWVTNELDPESAVVRALMIALMLAALLMAVAIPRAFGSDALLFAGSYVAIQVGRHLFLTFGSAVPHTPERERGARILGWFVASAPLWIAGAIAGGTAQTILWVAALLLDYGAPLVLYWAPRRPRLGPGTWDVESAHFAERFQLFVIIALGESIVVTGATTSQAGLDFARGVALATAFLTTAAMWWLYFTYVARIAQRRLELSHDRTKLARDGYTYLHVLMVAGVIVSAVGDELLIAHPTEELTGPQIAAVVGGPAIYLLAHTLFRLRMAGTLSVRRLAGAIACVALGALGAVVPALVLGIAVLAVLVGVIAAEHAAAVRRRARGEPSPLERLETTA